MELAIFVIFALLALVSAAVVVLHRDPVKSTLSLVVTLSATAVLFVLLGAPFVAVLQVLVYTGAIVVLFLFVIMLLNLQREMPTDSGGGQRWAAIGAGVLFTGLLAAAAWRATGGLEAAALDPQFVALKPFAAELFGRFLLPFEIIGLLLLVAVIGAFILAKRPEADEQTEPAGDNPEETR